MVTMLVFRLPVYFGSYWRRIWDCRFALAIAVSDGIWDVPFFLAIGDKLFGTYRIAHRIRGGGVVVCGCSKRVCGYLGVSYVMGFIQYVEALFGICLGVWICLPERQSLMIIRYDPNFHDKTLPT